MIGDYLDQYTYDYLLESSLSKIPDTVDKREGSIIFDALAPACAALAQTYVQLKGILIETYVLTASGEYLDYRVKEQGLTRMPATKAVKKATFAKEDGTPINVPIGSRFSTVDLEQNLTYLVKERFKQDGAAVEGVYQLECNTAGSIGNTYTGRLLPIDFINGLTTATMTGEGLLPARDEESDDALRTRFLEVMSRKPFGGNIAQYEEEIEAMTGVGAVQIYPVWKGGGTVKCSIIGADFNVASETLLNKVQEALYPEGMIPPGGGLGMVPIGHRVTVTTAKAVPIHIGAKILVASGFNESDVKDNIELALENYLLGVRKQWGTADELNCYVQNVYISQINYAILSVAGVENVTDITLNGGTLDVKLTETAETQEIPVLGQVKINEKP